MSRYSGQIDIEALLRDIDPESVVIDLGSEYRRQAGQSGEQINIKECPRCGGRDWKVFLNAESGLGNCFHGSCVGEPGFNLYTFSKHLLGTPKEAFDLLKVHADNMSWKPKRTKKAEKVRKSIQTWSDNLKLPRSVALPYKDSVGKYLHNRGFTKHTVEFFQWRFSQDGHYAYPFENEMRYQGYERRIIIPIFDLAGKLVTFQGRDITGQAEKKYLFPPGLPGTSLYLYNGHNAVGSREIVINEGALDVAAAFQAFQADPLLREIPAVGTFGKVLSMGRQTGEDQLGALLTLKEKGLEEITMMWDSEPKTLKEAAGTAHKLAKYGFKVRVAVLPEGKDPNEASEMEVRDAYRKATPVNTNLEHLRFLSKSLG